MKLTKEEQEIEDSLDLATMRTPDALLLAMLKEAARNTFRRNRRVNIRLTERDLAGIKQAAEAKGVPHSTLISGIIHQYVEGNLTERPRGREQRKSVGS